MKQRLLSLLLLLAALPTAMWADTFINLTPKPKAMTVKSGSVTLPAKVTVACEGTDEMMTNEAQVFVDALVAAGLQAEVTTGGDAFVKVTKPATALNLKTGGYTFAVSEGSVSIEANEAIGLFYAFQTFKKLLPPHVMAGVKDDAVGTYELPLVTISDEPRFEYRGFMLDVSRHFFSVAEVKRMLDVMSYYKMNKFHWHLTDDQGWRAEIKKYPKLTTIGATAPNSRFTSLEEARAYWINKPYGPYFYTQDQMREVVAYAKKLHIDVIPEVDMPGHFAAAMTAYPEFSCSPNGAHSVWDNGGISNDVLNVANPKAMQFIYDVIDELTDIFPYEYFNMGGDECPTTAWTTNDDCKKLYAAEGFTDWRQLQSWFIAKVDSVLKKKGRKAIMWNESVTAKGADVNEIKNMDAAILCWYPANEAVEKAHSLGLKSIYTTWGPYYINRKQGNGPQDPPGAADGSDHVKATYNQNIPANVNFGVQGTFWCEWVSDSTYMEWLALPRLIAIAEAGWTPQNRRNFDDFIARAAADTTLLNYRGYRYCKYFMPGESSNDDKVMPLANKDGNKYYYRIISGGSDGDRKDRCIEVLAEGSPLISQYSGNGAQVNRLWTSPQATEGADNYNYQWWSIEEDPANPGKYALVCKAMPDGSVKPNPTATAVTGRWEYDPSVKHYNFQLGTGAYGKKGTHYYYSISSDKVDGQYFNSSMPRQGLAVNVYNNPGDGGGGQWEFSPMEDYGGDDSTPSAPVDSIRLEEGKLYVFTNDVKGFDGTMLADDGKASTLSHSTDAFANNAWKVAVTTNNADGTQTVTLQNAATGRYVGTAGAFANKLGRPVAISASGAAVTLSPAAAAAVRVMVGGKSLFPLPAGLVYAGANVDGEATYDAPVSQGAVWKAQQVRVVTFVCKDDRGGNLGTVRRSVPVDVTEIGAGLCPTFKNNAVETVTEIAADTYEVVYKRFAYAIVYQVTDDHGVIVAQREDTARVGDNYTVMLPAVAYYKQTSADRADGSSFVPDSDCVINAVYTTDAITGVKADGQPVTTVEAGKYYLMYDATTASGRAGYRLVRSSDNQINRSITAEGLGANAVWTLEASGDRYKVLNVGADLYVPQLQRSQPTTASSSAETFAFALNDDGATWNILGRNGQYWDGVESGALVGWDGGKGHPIRISTFYGKPMYSVTITCTDEASGRTLQTVTDVVDAGSAYEIVCPEITGYTLKSTTGAESYTGTVETYVNVKAVYASVVSGISDINGGESAANGRLYNLQGQRIGQGYKGIVVRDGKKMVVK